MKYDFSTRMNRKNCGAIKWNIMYKSSPNLPDGIVPLSIADMEFKSPPEITNGLKEYLDQMILGYTSPTDAYYDAIISWMERRHHYTIQKEWIVQSMGIVPALFNFVQSLTAPSDGVIIMPPVYYPFYMAIKKNGRTVVENKLINEGGIYRIDFDDLEEKAARPENKMLLFCSPHNPVGRVWSKEELLKVADICLRHHVFLVSDEIHADLILPKRTHIPLGSLSPEIAAQSAICTAPSKTFNIAGLQVSNIIIPNNEIREKFIQTFQKLSIKNCNMLANKACELAYNQCEEWLDQLIIQIDKNRQLFTDFFREKLPELTVSPLEGTYLMWVDFRPLGLDSSALEKWLHMEANAFLDEGTHFGEGGDGFERFNIACPQTVLLETLNRIHAAVQRLYSQS